jgi:hypothetical protein
VHDLLAEPTRDQALLLDVVYAGRKAAGSPNFKRAGSQGMQRVGQLSGWPTFLYVESVLAREHGIEGAVDDLRAFFALRVGRQHPGADQRATGAIQRLGLTLPITDWGGAWQQLQGTAVAALSALREEVEGLDPP